MHLGALMPIYENNCFRSYTRFVTDKPKLATNPNVPTRFKLDVDPESQTFSLTQIKSLLLFTKTSSMDIEDTDTTHGKMTLYWTVRGDWKGQALSAELSFGEFTFYPRHLSTAMTICRLLDVRERLELEEKDF